MGKMHERLRSLVAGSAYADRDLVADDFPEVVEGSRGAVATAANMVREMWKSGDPGTLSYAEELVTKLAETVTFAEYDASADPRELAKSALGEPSDADPADSPRRLAAELGFNGV